MAKTNTALLAEQAVRCYRLRLKGRSLREIGAEVGLDHATVHRRLQWAIQHRVAESVDELRAKENDGLDALEAEAWRILDGATDVDVKLKAMDRIERFKARRAKLNGLDAPQRIEATITEETEQDREMKALVAQMEQRNAERQAQIDGAS